MAKTKSATSSASSAPAGKSKKPRMPGINRIKNTPKAFRSSDKTGLNHLICCKKQTAFKLGDKIMQSKKYLKEQARREQLDALMAKSATEGNKSKAK